MLSLDGVTVLDLTRLLPGPFATHILAEQGARVIKVEEPFVGDGMREVGPRLGDSSHYFDSVNSGKFSVAIDLKSLAGRAAFLRMAERADIIIEGFRPGVMERLDLAPPMLIDLCPRLVIARLSGFGQSGPLSNRPGHDLNYLALSGVQALLSEEGERPHAASLPIADLVGASSAVTGILFALLRRARTNAGCIVDASMFDSLVGLLAIPAALLHANGPSADVRGVAGSPSYDTYETADGRWVAVACLEPKFWDAFVSLLGLSHLADSPLYPDRFEQVRREIATVIRTRSMADWEGLFARNDVCASAVLEPAEALNHPHTQFRDLVITRDSGGSDSSATVRSSVRLDAHSRIEASTAPRRGADTEAVLMDAGYSSSEIEAMASDRSVELG